MPELIGLAAALLLVVLVQMLRAILALPFPRYHLHPLVAPSALHADFLAAQVEALRALGFAEPRWWALQREDGNADTLPLRGVLAHADGAGLCWIAPAVNVRMPHRPLIYFSHRLQDGRVAISQPFDCYFAIGSTDEIVARTAGETTLAEQWQAHQRWVASLASAPKLLDEFDIDDQAAPLLERQRQALIARGDLRALGENLALPRFGFALRALWAYLRIPRAPVDPRPVPVDRLLAFAAIQERVQRRAPPRSAQWLLFAASVALFMAAGALLWDPEFAAAILLVVLIHELGHFLAMRAFGYRNVHILALPLVGGVAMGVDANPSATRRAWMSLMGPLPGIVIGWILLLFGFVVGDAQTTPAFVLPLAMAFLFVNYLNVLPIPPLDGAHVLENLLPPRWARAQTVLIGVAALAGAWLAWQWGFTLLAALALLQLPAVLASWRLHGVDRVLASTPVPRRQSRGERLRRVFDALDQSLGTTPHAAVRVRQALQIQHRLDTRPMGTTARVLTAVVYLALLAVPLAGLLFWSTLSGRIGGTDFEATVQAEQARRDAWRDQARTLALDELLRGARLPEEAIAPAVPATVEAIDRFAARFGQALPAELQAVYAIADGDPGLGLRPLDAIEPAREFIVTNLQPYDDVLHVELTGGHWEELPFAEAGSWWLIGGDEEAPLFYLPVADPRLPGVRVVDYLIESPSVWSSMREWLESRWRENAQVRDILVRRALAETQAHARLAKRSTAELLAVWPQPGLATRLLTKLPGLPDPASEVEPQAAGQRLGIDLPDQLSEVLRMHDGFMPLGLLPSRDILAWTALDAGQRGQMLHGSGAAGRQAPGEGAAGEPLPRLEDDDLAGCIVVAGWQGIASAGADRVHPQLLWCPTGRHAGWIDLVGQRHYPNLRDWLLQSAVRVETGKRLMEAE